MTRRLAFTRLTSSEQPILFMAISFIAGLLLASRRAIPIGCWLASGAFAWLLCACCLVTRRDKYLINFIIWCGFFFAGGVLWALDAAGTGNDRVRRLLDLGILSAAEPVEIYGTLIASPELAPDRIYLSVSVERASTLGREYQARGAIQITVPFNDYDSRAEYDSLDLDYGTRLRMLAHLSGHRGYRNPGAPDFDRILEDRGFDARGWVKSPLLIERLDQSESGAVIGRLYRLRARAIAVTLRQFSQPSSGILVAALFGNRYFLSKTAADSFRAGGTFHLLVISGLHVALIAVMALRLARLLSNSRAVQYSIAALVVWAYALMVGAQPAVTRSAVMLTFVLAGKSIFYPATGANALSAAAITLLAWHPRDIFNSGFQLSFLTVALMVALTGPIYSRIKEIGEWRPAPATPYPPRAPRCLKRFAEALFWNERRFREEMKESRIRYRLDKNAAALWLNRLRLQKALAWVAMTIIATIGVQLGLLPLMILQFHRVSIVSPIVNVIDGALVFALMSAGAAYLALYSIVGDAISSLAFPVNALGRLTAKASEPLVSIKIANLRPPDFGEASWLIYSAYFTAILALVVVLDGWNPLRKGDEKEAASRKLIGGISASLAAAIVIILGFAMIAYPFSHSFEPGRLSVTFLDVGQGDAILMSFPQGRLMLLDSGGRLSRANADDANDHEEAFIEDRIGIAEAAVMPCLWRRGIKRLDWIAASHGDADHVEGFIEIIRSFEIERALKSHRPGRSPGDPDIFDQAVRSSGIPLHTAGGGDVFEIDGARIHILSPPSNRSSLAKSDNNDSLVLKITFGERSFLMTGDIEKEAELDLVSQGIDLKADVLKAAHHGSKTSSTAEFIEKADPRHVVISVADPNPYGHPHREVVERLRRNGARIWKTSECGAVTISTDGMDLRVETFVRCE